MVKIDHTLLSPFNKNWEDRYKTFIEEYAAEGGEEVFITESYYFYGVLREFIREELQRNNKEKCEEFLSYLCMYQRMIETHPQKYDPDEWNTVETIKERFKEIFL